MHLFKNQQETLCLNLAKNVIISVHRIDHTHVQYMYKYQRCVESVANLCQSPHKYDDHWRIEPGTYMYILAPLQVKAKGGD